MNWAIEWQALSNRIRGLLDAGSFYINCSNTSGGVDPYRVADKELLPHARKVWLELTEFRKRYDSELPIGAGLSLRQFLDSYGGLFAGDSPSGVEGVQFRLTALASIRTELEHLLTDQSIIIQRLSERAFQHLQRSIIVDERIRESWQRAFKEKGEIACEQLGMTHLLLHGIWAFKINTKGERTDLIYNEPIDVAQIQRAAQALVLTEWKIVRDSENTERLSSQARVQAARYSAGALTGLELSDTRYIVLVSWNVLPSIAEVIDKTVQYRHINIAVAPSTPSRS